MLPHEIKTKVDSWIKDLINKELTYISGRNKVIITDFSPNEKKLTILRDSTTQVINTERIEKIILELLKGRPVHTDTFFGSGGNDRSIIETILCHFPNVGFMLANQGRNLEKNKVIQWLDEEFHELGTTNDISDRLYEEKVIKASIAHGNANPLPKPFLLLAGISGTGKSRFVRQQAQVHNRADNFCLVAVRPDWHEPSDLLGYSSRLSGKTEYVATDVLRFLVAAWRDLLQWGMQLEGDGSQTQLVGNSGQLDSAVPFWLCLDEMNLAPVEQYFADYLSLIETRNWAWDGEGFEYDCYALLNASALNELKPEQQDELARDLELEAEDEADALLWQHFLDHGIAIPPNLIVAGTVNMDETTHGFSRKVIDRAMSFDFGEFFPNDFDDFYAAKIKHEALTFPRHSSGKKAIADKTAAEPSIEFLKVVNKVLKGSPFELAFRALNELLLAVSCHSPQSAKDLQAVWDDFLMQKVLPRIEGDFEKLQGDETSNLLTRLQAELESQLQDIWLGEKARTDFYRYTEDAPNQPEPMAIECRSRRKIEWMLDRLKNHGFTSFWP